MTSRISGPASTAGHAGLPGFGTSAIQLRAASRPLSFLESESGRAALTKYATLAGRLLLSQIFLISGVMKLVDWSGTEARMAEQGMFWIPFFLGAATLVELGAGLALLAGFQTRLAALLLFLYLIPVTFTLHHFWSYPP